jgi:UDP-N-acetylglucosamine acyltransferase
MHDQGNEIHPSVILEGNVELGTGNVVGPNCVLIGPLSIGDRNLIGPNVVIGTPGQDTRNPRHDSRNRPIVIGDDNIIREFSAIQKPVYTDNPTRLGNRIYVMQGVHIPHDARLEDHVTLTPNVVLAGMATIMTGATLALGVTVAQRIVIGPFSIVAMGAAVTKNIRPFSRYIPGKPITVNSYMIEKHHFEDSRAEIEAYVLSGSRPTTPEIKEIISDYEELSSSSQAGEY